MHHNYRVIWSIEYMQDIRTKSDLAFNHTVHTELPDLMRSIAARIILIAGISTRGDGTGHDYMRIVDKLRIIQL